MRRLLAPLVIIALLILAFWSGPATAVTPISFHLINHYKMQGAICASSCTTTTTAVTSSQGLFPGGTIVIYILTRGVSGITVSGTPTGTWTQARTCSGTTNNFILFIYTHKIVSGETNSYSFTLSAAPTAYVVNGMEFPQSVSVDTGATGAGCNIITTSTTTFSTPSVTAETNPYESPMAVFMQLNDVPPGTPCGTSCAPASAEWRSAGTATSGIDAEWFDGPEIPGQTTTVTAEDTVGATSTIGIADLEMLQSSTTLFPNVEQSCTVDIHTAATPTCTFGTSTDVGDVLIAIGNSNFGVTTQGGWTQIFLANNSQVDIAAAYQRVTAAGTTAAPFALGTNGVEEVWEVGGIPQTGNPIDTSASSENSVAAPGIPTNTLTITPAQSGDLILSSMVSSNNTAPNSAPDTTADPLGYLTNNRTTFGQSLSGLSSSFANIPAAASGAQNLTWALAGGTDLNTNFTDMASVAVLAGVQQTSFQIQYPPGLDAGVPPGHGLSVQSTPTASPTPPPATPPPVLPVFMYVSDGTTNCAGGGDRTAYPGAAAMQGAIWAAQACGSNITGTMNTDCGAVLPGGNYCGHSSYIDVIRDFCNGNQYGGNALFSAMVSADVQGFETEWNLQPGSSINNVIQDSSTGGACTAGTFSNKIVYIDPHDSFARTFVYQNVIDCAQEGTGTCPDTNFKLFPSTTWQVWEDDMSLLSFPCHANCDVTTQNNGPSQYGNVAAATVGNGSFNVGVSYSGGIGQWINHICPSGGNCYHIFFNGTHGGGNEGACSNVVSGHCYGALSGNISGIRDNQNDIDDVCTNLTNVNLTAIVGERPFMNNNGTSLTSSQNWYYLGNDLADVNSHNSDNCAATKYVMLDPPGQGTIPASQGRMLRTAFAWLFPSSDGSPDRNVIWSYATGGDAPTEVPLFPENINLVPFGPEIPTPKYAWNGVTTDNGSGCPATNGDTGGMVAVNVACSGSDGVFCQQYHHVYYGGVDEGPGAACVNTSTSSQNIVSGWFARGGSDPISTYHSVITTTGGEAQCIIQPATGTIQSSGKCSTGSAFQGLRTFDISSACSSATNCGGNVVFGATAFAGDGTDVLPAQSGILLSSQPASPALPSWYLQKFSFTPLIVTPSTANGQSSKDYHVRDAVLSDPNFGNTLFEFYMQGAVQGSGGGNQYIAAQNAQTGTSITTGVLTNSPCANNGNIGHNQPSAFNLGESYVAVFLCSGSSACSTGGDFSTNSCEYVNIGNTLTSTCNGTAFADICASGSQKPAASFPITEQVCDTDPVSGVVACAGQNFGGNFSPWASNGQYIFSTYRPVFNSSNVLTNLNEDVGTPNTGSGGTCCTSYDVMHGTISGTNSGNESPDNYVKTDMVGVIQMTATSGTGTLSVTLPADGSVAQHTCTMSFAGTANVTNDTSTLVTDFNNGSFSSCTGDSGIYTAHIFANGAQAVCPTANQCIIWTLNTGNPTFLAHVFTGSCTTWACNTRSGDAGELTTGKPFNYGKGVIHSGHHWYFISAYDNVGSWRANAAVGDNVLLNVSIFCSAGPSAGGVWPMFDLTCGGDGVAAFNVSPGTLGPYTVAANWTLGGGGGGSCSPVDCSGTITEYQDLSHTVNVPYFVKNCGTQGSCTPPTGTNPWVLNWQTGNEPLLDACTGVKGHYTSPGSYAGAEDLDGNFDFIWASDRNDTCHSILLIDRIPQSGANANIVTNETKIDEGGITTDGYMNPLALMELPNQNLVLYAATQYGSNWSCGNAGPCAVRYLSTDHGATWARTVLYNPTGGTDGLGNACTAPTIDLHQLHIEILCAGTQANGSATQTVLDFYNGGT